jgi:maltose alpha-D-glucosyltransferase/alpha-amylase
MSAMQSGIKPYSSHHASSTDYAKLDTSLWYKDAVFYEIYVRAFKDSNADGHGDLAGLTEKLNYLQDLGIDCIWLLPIYPSPLKDDGYDVADYYDIHQDYGTIDDLKVLIAAAHARGIRVLTDFVINHTSDQHDWFQAARSNRKSPYRDFYVWSDNDQLYKDARIIFIDTQISNWAWDEIAKQYYWHRFFSHQPDLNFENPDVRANMKDIARFWLGLGIDGFRVDAAPYLFERNGTNCENLPETHEFLVEFRRFIDDNFSGKILLSEANQWPEDVRPYFGDGDEFHMAFHFPLMPRIFMAIRKEEHFPITHILNRTPSIPDNCQWCTFLRNHDELTLEMVTIEERQWMWQEYAPIERMRLNLGIRRRLAPLLENNQRKIKLANSLLFTLPGTPIIYYGDEIGMGDHIWLNDRDGLRTPMQWSDGFNAGFSQAAPNDLYSPLIDHPAYGPNQVNVEVQKSDLNSLYNTLRKMIKVRKQHRAFGWGDLTWMDTGNEAVLAYSRSYENDRVLILNNLSSIPQKIQIDGTDRHPPPLTDILTNKKISFSSQNRVEIELSPYEYRWLSHNDNPEKQH